MSAKWVRSKQWDDQFFPRWAWPAKFVLRAFSSIWLALLLLSGVAVFGILASIPIGMIAAIPTYLIYGLTLVGLTAVVAVVPAWLARRALQPLGRGVSFSLALALLAGLTVGSFWGWKKYVWPELYYHTDVVDGVAVTHGFMLFPEFVEQYKSLPLRRLPGMEMSELEFYAWWPMELILIAFVLNMTIATLRRIEFKFVNLGVLTVHTGIIIIALGSVYYAALKQEGDVLLIAGEPDEAGKPTPGRVEPGFFDNTHTVLWINQGKGWEQRALRGLPRYNDYNLHALGAPAGGDESANQPGDGGRTLNIQVPDESPRNYVDGDLTFRVVGYANYAHLDSRWRPVDEPGPGAESKPVRVIELHSTLAPDGSTTADAQVAAFPLIPDSPPDRVMMIGQFVGVEYTRGMDDKLWAQLATPLPPGVQHGLVVEVTESMARQVVPIAPGTKAEVGGYTLEVVGLDPQPQFPIITKGYENGITSVARVLVTPPKAADGTQPAAFTRWVYARFPEISQDMLEELNERGVPKRRAADNAIKITYVDASMVQVHLDERVGATGEPSVRGLVRFPAGEVKAYDDLKSGSTIPFGDRVSLKLGQRWSHAERVEVPVVVPEEQRERERVGNHKKAAIAVEVTQRNPNDVAGRPMWQRTLWLPFASYLEIAGDLHRQVTLPDGRALTLVFGRRFHQFPGMGVQLLDFSMTPYPHSTQPRDFRSDVRIVRTGAGDQTSHEDRYTSLNDPLLVGVPFMGSGELGPIGNAIGRLVSLVAPNQYKFSQTGWDPSTWNETKAAADRGELPRAYARFTILGVGNNPGIYVIAFGAVLMSVGVPWAFYVKPWLLRREKQRLQSALAARARAAGSNGKHALDPAHAPVIVQRGQPAAAGAAGAEKNS